MYHSLDLLFLKERVSVGVDNSLAEFKRQMRMLTGRSWGVSMNYRLRKLGEYIRGWMGYYGLSEYYRPIPELDHWLRRRIRMCYWKQWRRCRKRVKELLKLGCSKRQAIFTALSRKSYLALIKDVCNSSWYDQSVAQETRANFYQRAMGFFSLPEQDEVVFMNRPVRTRMQGGVGRGANYSPLPD